MRVVQILVPLPVGPYPLWLGLGALSLDVLAAVIATSLLRHRLSRRVWKSVHWLSYASWPLAFAHSLGMGTDSSSAWFLGVAVTCAAAVAAAAAWRLTGVGQTAPKHLGAQLAPIEERTA